jgi:hypothetical protein
MPMAKSVAHPARKSTFRRLDKYLYLARTIGLSPATVIAVCVMANSGRSARIITRDLGIPADDTRQILTAAEPFLRKRRASR